MFNIKTFPEEEFYFPIYSPNPKFILCRTSFSITTCSERNPFIVAIADYLKPREVSWALQALDEVLRDAPYTLGDYRHVVRQKCRQLIRNADKITYAIRVDGYTPINLSLLLATGVTKELLLSGNFHYDRGQLISTGIGLKKLMHHLLNLQVATEIVSAKDMGEFLDFENQEIREIG